MLTLSFLILFRLVETNSWTVFSLLCSSAKRTSEVAILQLRFRYRALATIQMPHSVSSYYYYTSFEE